jgi:glycosyltransferase involved in cell wall biosynthesis
MKVLSIYWGFSHGGVAEYAANIELLRGHIPLELRSLCILPVGRDVDQGLLDSLDAIVLRVKSIVSLSWISRVRAIVAEEKPDCVMSHGFNGHLVSLIATVGMQPRVRRLASYHGGYHPNTRARCLVAPVYNGFTNWFLRNKADAIVSVAQYCVDALVECGVPARKFTVVHNGIPDLKPDQNKRTAIRNEWGYAPDHVVIGIASRLETIKGLDYLIEAFARVSSEYEKLRLVLIGDGTQLDSLRKLAISRTVDSRIEFAGMRSDVADCLSAIDIFALPSLSEAHSIGLLEAMRAGKAIVATDVGGNTESVRDGQEALIVQSADIDGLSEALGRLAGDTGLRVRLGEAARKRFCAEFTVEAMLTKTARWMQDVCAG